MHGFLNRGLSCSRVIFPKNHERRDADVDPDIGGIQLFDILSTDISIAR
jgi:hypothetical protein